MTSIIIYSTTTPYERGGMDSYYRRPFMPHKVVDNKKVTDLDGNEMQEYAKGFDDNESTGDHKDYG